MGDVLREWGREGCGSMWGVLERFRQRDRQGDPVSSEVCTYIAVLRFNIALLENDATKSCRQREKENNVPFCQQLLCEV